MGILPDPTPYLTLQTAALIILATLVLGYYKIFRKYTVSFEGPYDVTRKKYSKSLPAYTNGWFVIGPSQDLKNGQVVNVDKWGENIALFRGKDGVLYALEAYCSHMGANLAI